jgi:predicted nucleic acid-binding protein
MIEHLHSNSKVYFDSNILIYLIERTDELQQKIVQTLAMLEQTEATLHISTVGVAECVYGAHKSNSEKLLQQYQNIFYNDGLFNLVPIDSERIIRAAKLGAEKTLKLIDATHFLSAVEMGCDIFLTNDRNFRSSHNVTVVQLDDL